MAAEAAGLAATLSDWFVAESVLLVTDVKIEDATDLEALVRFLVDPAYARGFDLYLIGIEPDEDQVSALGLDLDALMLWERLQYVMQRVGKRAVLDGLPPLTPIEEMLLEGLRAAGLSPRVQYDIPPFRVDFAFEDVNLAVEADGREWHDPDKDRSRDEKLEELGWHVMHFSGADIWADAKSCAEQVVARRATLSDGVSRVDPERRSRPSGPAAQGLQRNLDPEQIQAVTSGSGVVQVIAPAGSGKTTVLVERVRFLLSHGMPAPRILSTTFSKDAALDLRRRFDASGISTYAETRTFHSLGRYILDEEGKLPPNELSGYSWKRLSKRVSDQTGLWIEPDELKEQISYFKLIEMKEPDELEADPSDDLANARITAYKLYEQERNRRKAWSFDDLIFLAVKLLQSDEEVRARWQKRWWYVLVDEYQDIEPAQEQLIFLISSPHDNLFVVGDEDQCIYTWRRADVRRIMSLHRRFPSLERSILKVNYRSGSKIVSASRVLIENNKIRFAKDIEANRTDLGEIVRVGFSEDPQNSDQLSHAFERVRDCTNTENMAVLCRTNTLLRDLAIRCITSGLEIKANDRILKPSLAEDVILSYLRMCLRPEQADPSDVETALRNPNVYLMESHAPLLLNALRAGRSFEEAFAGLPIPERDGWRRREQAKVAPRLDHLKSLNQATLAMVHIRRELGLDDHFDARAREGAPSEDADALNGVSGLAAQSSSTSDLLDQLLLRKDALERARNGNGVELTSIHGAKGREWANVLLIGADEQRLPLVSVVENRQPSFTVTNGWEDERRLAYVAMTRAKDSLTICWSNEPSPFVLEALDGADPMLLERETRSRLAERQEAREKAAKKGSKGAKTSAGRREFVAKHISTCDLCGSHVVPGQLAVPFDDRFVHVGCVRDAAVLPPSARPTSPSGRTQGTQRRTSRQSSQGAKRGPRQGKRGFPAKFPGWCDLCEKKYPVGEIILPLDGKYVHVGCGLP
jgi:DNA helicase-2/ATP-dependent DNA helicase PcrA